MQCNVSRINADIRSGNNSIKSGYVYRRSVYDPDALRTPGGTIS
ncbi:MAG TPA: hypothetical protein PLN48_05795 [Lachnospiraceae bacterium]|nr:hypothetical protein [Lachnospiraceae bacterium]